MKLRHTILISAMTIAMAPQAYSDTSSDKTLLNQQFIDAIKMRDSGDLFASIEMLEKLMETQPEYKRAQLELAVAYYRATLYGQAKEHAEKVLDDPNTPAEVKETIGLFLSQLSDVEAAENENRHSLEGSIGFGFGRDSNVNASPADELVNINGIQFTLTDASQSKSDNFGTVNAQVTHTYDMPGTLNIGSRPVKSQWTTTLAGSKKAYGKESEFNLNVWTLQTGIGLLSSTNWRAGLNARLDHISLGGQHLGTFKGLNGSWTIVEGLNQITLSGDVTLQEFSDDANEGREGLTTTAGVEYQRQFKQDLLGLAGLTLSRHNADDDNQQYTSKKLNAGVFYTVTPETLLYGQASYMQKDYNGVEPVYNTGRNDNEKAFTVGLSHDFTSGVMNDWNMNVKASRYNNNSDISIYEYDRSEASAELTRKF